LFERSEKKKMESLEWFVKQAYEWDIRTDEIMKKPRNHFYKETRRQGVTLRFLCK
jgi:hypothetical protein